MYPISNYSLHLEIINHELDKYVDHIIATRRWLTLYFFVLFSQGFILDGYPKTYEQAKELFAGKVIDFMQNLSFTVRIQKS